MAEKTKPKILQLIIATFLIVIFMCYDGRLNLYISALVGFIIFDPTYEEIVFGKIETWKMIIVGCGTYLLLFPIVMKIIAAVTRTPANNSATLFGIALIIKFLLFFASYFFMAEATFFNVQLAYLVIIALFFFGTKQQDSKLEG